MKRVFNKSEKKLLKAVKEDDWFTTNIKKADGDLLYNVWKALHKLENEGFIKKSSRADNGYLLTQKLIENFNLKNFKALF